MRNWRQFAKVSSYEVIDRNLARSGLKISVIKQNDKYASLFKDCDDINGLFRLFYLSNSVPLILPVLVEMG